LPMLWMSPEATLYNKFSAASDVYMFGAFLYELFARVRPYTGIGMGTVMRMKQMQQIDVRPMITENCPLKLRKMITDCWAYDPPNRPKMQDINDILVDLQREVENCLPHDITKTFDIGAEPVFPVETTEFKETTEGREQDNYSAYHKVGFVEEGKTYAPPSAPPSAATSVSTGGSPKQQAKENIYDTPYLEMTTTRATRATATSSVQAINSALNAGLGNATDELTKQQSQSTVTTPLLHHVTSSSSSAPTANTTPSDNTSDNTTAPNNSSGEGVSKENVSSVSALVNAFSDKQPDIQHSSPEKTSVLRLTGTKETMRVSNTGV